MCGLSVYFIICNVLQSILITHTCRDIVTFDSVLMRKLWSALSSCFSWGNCTLKEKILLLFLIQIKYMILLLFLIQIKYKILLLFLIQVSGPTITVTFDMCDLHEGWAWWWHGWQAWRQVWWHDDDMGDRHDNHAHPLVMGVMMTGVTGMTVTMCVP